MDDSTHLQSTPFFPAISPFPPSKRKWVSVSLFSFRSCSRFLSWLKQSGRPMPLLPDASSSPSNLLCSCSRICLPVCVRFLFVFMLTGPLTNNARLMTDPAHPCNWLFVCSLIYRNQRFCSVPSLQLSSWL